MSVNVYKDGELVNIPAGKANVDILETTEAVVANTESGKVTDSLVTKSVIRQFNGFTT